MCNGLKSPSPVLGTKNSDTAATEDEEFWLDEDDVTPRRPSCQLELRQQSPLQLRSEQAQSRSIDGMTPAERCTLEGTVAATRLRTRHHDSYEAWECDTRRDALHTDHYLHTSTDVTHAAHFQSTDNSALLTQHSTYTSQLADVQRLLEGIRIKQHYEEEQMRQRWAEEGRTRKDRIERVIGAEEDRLRAKLDADQGRREEEERRWREDEEGMGMEEEQRRKLEKAKMKTKEEEEWHEREKEDADAEGRRAMGIASAQEDWKYARKTLKNLKSGPMKSVMGDKALKSQWNVIRWQITSKIVQLTQDQETISRITHQLLELVCPSTPLPQPLYLAALCSLSRSILLRAETEVTVVKESALPLAIVACALLHHPSLSDTFPEVFFAKMVQRTGGWGVPVVVPMHDVDEKPWGEGERRKAMGYRYTGRSDNGGDDNGEWESAGEYSTRIAGIMRVYFLVLSMSASAPTPALAAGAGAGAGQVQVSRAQKLFQLPRFWTYFVRMLGDEHLLETAVAAQVLYAALDVVGLEAGHIWGKQWIKLLELLYEASTVGVDSSAVDVASGLLGSGVGTNTPRTKASGNGNVECAQKRMRMLGGQTPEGKSSRVMVQLEIERILREL
ncbi:hypothetical protein SCLCIDRAFT_668779 [Scleroderma citrinum Foug A]|uniref:mRNA export factor GLE1 n=1 Tax=Scleroderma citrinum Foug A TaxID=1036808 RepID=A0A0C2YN75_9AGAM|nr:hypothetical protein SCLCIDRAFT_668779 [Scleroderma citrinum Foug A]